MKANEQTLQQIERAIRKTAEKYPASEEPTVMTDLHIRVAQDTGEMVVYNDDDQELTRCIVEQWIDNKDDDFYQQVASIIRRCIERHKDVAEHLAVLKPYSFVLEDDDKETMAELYLVDDDTVIIDPELMAGLDDDLNKFLEQLLKD